jgi:opacity protein-like surface antigen
MEDFRHGLKKVPEGRRCVNDTLPCRSRRDVVRRPGLEVPHGARPARAFETGSPAWTKEVSMFRKGFILAACGLTLALAPAVEAVENATGFGLGARFGFLKNRETDEKTNMPGIQARIRGEHFGVEGTVDYRSEELAEDVHLRSWPVSASLLVYPVSAVYAVAGAGWYHTTLDFDDDSVFEDRTETDFGWHVGGGVELPVARSVKITGDMRWIYLDQKFEDMPEAIRDASADSFQMTAGVLFYMQ